MPRNVFEIMIHMKMLDEGIVPYGVVPPAILEQLNNLSDDDRRKMKRKFRKLWRKAYKKHGMTTLKDNNDSITRGEKSRRLVMVYTEFREVVLKQMKAQSD